MKSLIQKKLKHILLVDDDKSFLQSAVDGLENFSREFKVFTAENGKQAVELLQSQKMDLVITDLKMPYMDGFELLSFMNNNHPTIPVIVLTAFGTPEVEWSIENLSPLQYLEKPIAINELADKIKKGLDIKSKGFIQSIISLPSLLNLIEKEKKTCTLRVRSQDKTGFFTFDKGELLFCQSNENKGTDAVFEILKWKDILITVSNGSNQNKRNINLPISNLLKEEFFQKAAIEKQKKRSRKNKKEKPLNAKKMQEVVEILKEDLGSALITSDIWDESDGRSIAAHNPMPKASALFNRITNQLRDALRESEFPPLEGYYSINLADKILALVLPLEDFQIVMLVDTKQFQVGLLLNVTIPKILKSFNETMGK